MVDGERRRPVAPGAAASKVVAGGAVVFVVTLALALLGLEVTLRWRAREEIVHHAQRSPLWIQNQTLVAGAVDEILDRRPRMIANGLFKVDETIEMAAVGAGGVVLDFAVRTNNMGLLSDRRYAVPRSARAPEYRIVVFGDSLTGTTTANYQWVDTVEDLLNAKAELRAQLGATFRVYNLGWPAAGFPTFWKAYEQAGRQFAPDMIVVNFVYDDFPRAEGGPRLRDEGRMVEQAASVLRRFQGEGKRLVVAQMPIFSELFPVRATYPLTDRLAPMVPFAPIVQMRDELPLAYGQGEVETWYNYPYDGHMSDRGGEIYARAMAGVIARRLTGRSVDFSLSPSAHFDPAICLPGTEVEPREYLEDGDFSAVEDGALLRVGEEPRDVGRGWRALAGGVGGGGTAELTVHTADEGPRRFVRFDQKTPSTAGVPSLTKFVGKVDVLGGRRAVLSFRARARPAGLFRVTFYQYYGSGGPPPREISWLTTGFDVTPDWAEIRIPVSIPDIAGHVIGTAGDDHFRFAIFPHDPGKPFALEVGGVRLNRVKSSGTTAAQLAGCARRPRPSSTVSRVAGDAGAIKRLRGHVQSTMTSAKVWGAHSWAMDRILRRVDPLVPPLTRPLVHGFVPVRYGDGGGDAAYLNVFCTSPPVALTNPACYNSLHHFVK